MIVTSPGLLKHGGTALGALLCDHTRVPRTRQQSQHSLSIKHCIIALKIAGDHGAAHSPQTPAIQRPRNTWWGGGFTLRAE
jgi:hypothetical protein